MARIGVRDAALALGGMLLLAVAWLIAIPSSVAADPGDPQAPGTLVINDGSQYTNNPTLTLHVPAFPGLDVVSIEVTDNGVAEGLQPYGDPIQYTLSGGDADHLIRVGWYDATLGHAFSNEVPVTLDRQLPVVGQITWPADPDETDLVRPVSIPSDDGYPIETLWLSSNGTTWSPPMPWADTVDWHYLDPALGGSTKVGPRTLYVRAQDPAGNLSKVATVSTFIYVDAPIDVSPDPTTGHKITLTPHYPAPVTFPAGTHCYWEVMWGDDQSLYYGNRDETFGFFYTYGPATDGFCKPLAFTLPWMQYPRVMVHYRVEPGSTGESTTDEYIGASPDEPAIVPRIESTNRHITSSSIPLVYVLPDDYVLVLGQPTTYRAYAIGGAKITDNDLWSVDYTDRPEQKLGGTSFTFTPQQTGYITVCWGTDSQRKTRWAACYDPRSRHRDTSRPNTTKPVQHLGSGTVGSPVPVSITWDGSDIGWGIAKYQLERSVDGGPWKRILSKKTKHLDQLLATGHRYRYRVRAVDKAGHRGTWDVGATFRPRVVGDGSSTVGYTGAWTTADDATAAGGHLHESDAASANARFTFEGRDVAWVAERGAGHGKAEVFIDGKLVATVDLTAPADGPRRIVFRHHWASVGTHHLRIAVLGTTGRPTVDVDAFLVLR